MENEQYVKLPAIDDPSIASKPRNRVMWMVSGIAVVAVVALVATYASSSSSSSKSGPSRSPTAVRLPDEMMSGETLLAEEPIDLNSFYKATACPYAKWFASVHSFMGAWEDSMEDAYKQSWASHCADEVCPDGAKQNDHNYNTLLGQGNTIGFLGAHLDIQSVPSHLRFGLFENGGSFPVIARFSDFGADDSALRLGRVALKIYFPPGSSRDIQCPNGDVLKGDAWTNEINLLLTETMDAFPLADYADLAVFAKDPTASFWDSASNKFHALEVVGGSMFALLRARGKGMLYKEYYSQLPYALGCNRAMKFRLVPRPNSCDAGPNDETYEEGIRNHLKNCEANYELQVQTKILDEEYELITANAHKSWSEPYETVGMLVIPQQEVISGASTNLQAALASKFNLQGELANSVHKLLAFHPLMTLDAHRPLGEVNSYRAHYYSRHAVGRYQTIQRSLYAEAAEKPAYSVWGSGSNDWMFMSRLFD